MPLFSSPDHGAPQDDRHVSCTEIDPFVASKSSSLSTLKSPQRRLIVRFETEEEIRKNIIYFEADPKERAPMWYDQHEGNEHTRDLAEALQKRQCQFQKTRSGGILLVEDSSMMGGLEHVATPHTADGIMFRRARVCDAVLREQERQSQTAVYPFYDHDAIAETAKKLTNHSKMAARVKGRKDAAEAKLIFRRDKRRLLPLLMPLILES